MLAAIRTPDWRPDSKQLKKIHRETISRSGSRPLSQSHSNSKNHYFDTESLFSPRIDIGKENEKIRPASQSNSMNKQTITGETGNYTENALSSDAINVKNESKFEDKNQDRISDTISMRTESPTHDTQGVATFVESELEELANLEDIQGQDHQLQDPTIEERESIASVIEAALFLKLMTNKHEPQASEEIVSENFYQVDCVCYIKINLSF